MDWTNIQRITTRSNEFLDSEVHDRGTWISLLSYCTEQENGGRIDDCGKWAETKLQRTIGVGQADIARESALWMWDGDTLVVWAYPAEKQAIVQQKREIGKMGADARWGKDGKEPNSKKPDKPKAPTTKPAATDAVREPQTIANAIAPATETDSKRQPEAMANAMPNGIANAKEIACGMEGKGKGSGKERNSPLPKQEIKERLVIPPQAAGGVFATQTFSGSCPVDGALALQPRLAELLGAGGSGGSFQPRTVIQGTLDPPPRNEIAEAQRSRKMGKTIAEIARERLSSMDTTHGAAQPKTEVGDAR